MGIRWTGSGPEGRADASARPPGRDRGHLTTTRRSASARPAQQTPSRVLDARTPASVRRTRHRAGHTSPGTGALSGSAATNALAHTRPRSVCAQHPHRIPWGPGTAACTVRHRWLGPRPRNRQSLHVDQTPGSAPRAGRGGFRPAAAPAATRCINVRSSPLRSGSACTDAGLRHWSVPVIHAIPNSTTDTTGIPEATGNLKGWVGGRTKEPTDNARRAG